MKISLEEKIKKVNEALKLAESYAKFSPDPYRKVGAAVLDGNYYTPVSLGYNTTAEKFIEDKDFWKDKDSRKPFMIHAEIMALSKTYINSTDILVVTLKPCQNCMLAIAATGIKEIWYKDEKPNQEISNKIAEAYGISLKHISELSTY